MRKRPLNKKELAKKEDDIVTVSDNTYLTVHETKLKVCLDIGFKHYIPFITIYSVQMLNYLYVDVLILFTAPRSDCCIMKKVDLTAYVEKHEFCFDAVLDDHVTNDDVRLSLIQ